MIGQHLTFQQRRILTQFFVESQFVYYLLFFHALTSNPVEIQKMLGWLYNTAEIGFNDQF